MSEEILEYKKGSIICRQGEVANKLLLVKSGALLVFGVDGTKVTPFATIGENEFVGELSFFDGEKRSAYVIASTDALLIEISKNNKEEDMPSWLLHYATNQTKRLRDLDDVIMKKGIKRKKATTIAALSIEEQREILAAIEQA